MSQFDVYRDESGEPVTITEQQMYAVWHAFETVNKIRRDNDMRTLDGFTADGSQSGSIRIEASKSRLLGRMLFEGKAPLQDPPPNFLSGGWWEVVEEGHVGLSDTWVYINTENRTYPVMIGQFPWKLHAVEGDDETGTAYIISYREDPSLWRLSREVPEDCPPCGKTIATNPPSDIPCDWYLERIDA